jgi:hypothetical protein
MAAALFVASTLIGKRLSTLPARLTLPIGALLAAIGSALNWLLAVDAITLLPGLVLTGIGMGIAGPATSTALLAAAPPDRAGMASGAMATVRQLGQTRRRRRAGHRLRERYRHGFPAHRGLRPARRHHHVDRHHAYANNFRPHATSKKNR